MAIIAHEVWKALPGYEGFYEVSDWGRVRSLDRLSDTGTWKIRRKGEMCKSRINKNGYLTIKISKDGKYLFTSIHRLVAITFHPNPENLPQVNHEDGDKQNNIPENLTWCTCSENHLHSYATGLRIPKSGSQHNMAKLTESDVYEIKILLSKGYGQTFISKIYNISRGMIRNIHNNKNWTNVNLKQLNN